MYVKALKAFFGSSGLPMAAQSKTSSSSLIMIQKIRPERAYFLASKVVNSCLSTSSLHAIRCLKVADRLRAYINNRRYQSKTWSYNLDRCNQVGTNWQSRREKKPLALSLSKTWAPLQKPLKISSIFSRMQNTIGSCFQTILQYSRLRCHVHDRIQGFRGEKHQLSMIFPRAAKSPSPCYPFSANIGNLGHSCLRGSI